VQEDRVNGWQIVAGMGMLLADLGLVLALRRRVPTDRLSLYTLPFLVAGVVLLVLGAS
jgi:hypothetical protein